MIEHHRKIIDYLNSVGADHPRIEPARSLGHPRVVFLWHGRQMDKAVSATPSDTFWSTDKAIADLRRSMGLVERTKRVGARRIRRRPPNLVPRLNLADPLTITKFPADWRSDLSHHPAAVALLPGRADLAWRAWWREIMRSVGAESRL